MSIRTGLTWTIGAFVVLILMVIAIGYGVSKFARDGLLGIEQTSQRIATLKSSSEKLLKVRLALGSYETLFSVGQQSETLLTDARNLLAESNKNFEAYAGGPFQTDAERALAQAVVHARAELVTKAIEPEFAALDGGDVNAFRDIEGRTAGASYGVYAKAIDALEALQNEDALRKTGTVGERFRLATFMFAAIGALSIVVGMIARASLSAAVIRPVNQTIVHFERIASGDLTMGVIGSSHGEMGQLLRALGKMRASLVDTVAKVRGSSDEIACGAKEIASGNVDLSRRTSQQAAALEVTVDNVEQLSSAVSRNEDSAKEANRLAQGALQIVVRGGQVIEQAISVMDRVTESSRKVKEITGMIEGIAFQTNILALNAAVEAARAGEQGRGFAVVATEVRYLAQRSATAAKDIKGLIDEAASHVEQGTSFVQLAGGAMSEARGAVEHMTGIMAEIEGAAAEQSSGIAQVNQAISQIDDVTRSNVALVEQAAAAAKSLEQQVELLRHAVGTFAIEA
ncbi:MAG TPA: methyl-accepting chemotaxis protein [Trinickia sp.]|uniref:methyl-accepting chemotaxis protein n=1 Tax=Trinickia sp. TaxID=2571163 RepID=UPI002C24CB9E|nr:methyl-accepting chemotaxis protein [Trinickia sp.]HTI18805.1 methyl-accepting chemotaxis protein [Trinickia sp.]